MTSITNFFQNAGNLLKEWANYIFIIFGVILLIVGVYKIWKNFTQHGKQQADWLVSILCLLIGGLLVGSGAWNTVVGYANLGKNTLEDIASASGDPTDDGTLGGTPGMIGLYIPYYLAKLQLMFGL